MTAQSASTTIHLMPNHRRHPQMMTAPLSTVIRTALNLELNRLACESTLWRLYLGARRRKGLCPFDFYPVSTYSARSKSSRYESQYRRLRL